MYRTLSKIVCILGVVAALGAPAAQAQYSRPGSTSGDFLRIGVSARAAGMGDAYIASVRGAAATYYNPAALAWIEGDTHVLLNHTAWFAGINHEFLAATHNFGNVGTFGFSLTALYTDQMSVRTPLQPEGTGETFLSSNLRAGLSYARWLTDRVSFGGTLSYLNMSLYSDFVEHAFSADIAAAYTADFRDFRFAMMMGNLGTDVQYVNESYPLPVHFTFGMSMNAIEADNHTVHVSASAQKPNDGQPIGQVGAEYAFQDLFFVRGGYKINYDIASYTFGAGLNLDVSNYGLAFDYGYSAFGVLGIAHRFGLELAL